MHTNSQMQMRVSNTVYLSQNLNAHKNQNSHSKRALNLINILMLWQIGNYVKIEIKILQSKMIMSNNDLKLRSQTQDPN